MADFVATLVDMGFDENHAQAAVKATGNKGIDVAMDWILANPQEKPGQSVPAASASEPAGTNSSDSAGATANAEASSGKSAEDTVPKSYKCEDCGKLFTSMETVEFHAAKTNHSNFSESNEEKKPLTDEEKAEQQRKLHELMRIKRSEREAREKREEIEREKQRMASGKELLEAKRRMEEQEMKQIAEQRRREKIEDRQARERIKAQIEADKQARREKFGGGGGESNTAAAPVASPSVSAKPSIPDVPVEKKEYTETKIQVRLPNGKSLTQTFNINEPLAAVRVFVELNRTDGASGSFNLMTTFPKRVFVGDDYEAPLGSLGLVPSAVLMVTTSSGQ